MPEATNKKIDASPTKEFFISILVRDISLVDAVKDLIDNSVDGARRLRPDGDFSGLSVQIALTPEHFVIVDNCGGIPVQIAREYAFRFGRPPTVQAPPGTIGKFGVGMKRALFKIGHQIAIRSVAIDSRFSLNWNVEEWKRQIDQDGKDMWELEFTQVGEGESNSRDETGTTLEVTQLHPGIASEFGDRQFINRLVDEIESAHEQSIEAGLEIEVNDTEIRHKLASLFYSDRLRPMKVTQTFPANPGGEASPEDVKLTIVAGIAESSFVDAGWYVICNGRQVLRADKSKVTGWDAEVEGVKNPRAHNQFSRFRGYAHFESADPSRLPWNTAKSGLDAESKVYQWARTLMSSAMRQVIDFLNKLDAEIDTESSFLQSLVEGARPVRLAALPPMSAFSYPDHATESERPRLGRVSFQRNVEDIDFLKRYFGVSSAKLAGERSFDYVIERERDE